MKKREEERRRDKDETRRRLRLLLRWRIRQVRDARQRRAESAREQTTTGTGKTATDSEDETKKDPSKKGKEAELREEEETEAHQRLPHGLERAEPGQERPVRGRMQAVGQNDTGTERKSNHEPIWTRSYTGYRARRRSRDDGQPKRRKQNGRKVADIGQYQTSVYRLRPAPYAVRNSTECITPRLPNPNPTGDKRTRRGKIGRRVQQIQIPKRYDTSSKGPMSGPPASTRSSPFSHPRPIDRSSGLLFAACLVEYHSPTTHTP
ncbi:hypothetical protein MGYG_09047 [Nannizzia gypsea CBS 118893]|uniref:Uncharacterized protein n=1 Tax=Arthroderma gypseum (strain ATCC MYA-4604 / CBS 118893) TaxID=535722 RepID=E4USW6_ARTGP|nr:hypothetical protein MGYG_09047 [Nannizzia gypsea CBS 118893]EFR01415.1 hypothetical protein MGYG_09047 [Nannizzia gypsea CBS 118893]